MKHARSDYDRIQDPAGKIPVDEPVFLLRGQDKLAAEVVAFYARRARDYGLSEIAQLSEDHAQKMRDWPVHKTPDI